MFEHASPFHWEIDGNVIYRIDKIDGPKGGNRKRTEIARFRIFQVLGKSKLKGVSVDEAHDNAALVLHAVNFWKQAEPLLRRVVAGDNGVQHQEKAARLLKEFYPDG